ncbi:AMP-binding enzyme, partial [Stenotrophomonas maltophilia]|uniref:AMP-binding enzyme n=1 Tax=Stenotrophomonas maltophilia TaxID=40324 RepID=UPI0013D9FB48
ETLSAEGWLATGDLGRLGEDGRLEFLGRAKDIVRVGGENVSPAEIEDILHRHPAIRQAAVVGVPDPRLIEV